ncbi:MAG: sigma-54-dependent Fis family transcriptional regulator, partial [Proteobacteria bacterium]
MLSLVESESHLWERFLDGSVDPARVAADPLLRHWQRARALGVSAEGPAAPEGIGHEELLDRREREGELVHASGEALRGLETELARRGLIAILADRDGIVLHAVGGGRFLGSAARSRLIEGACWSEGSRGTNAIGTALSDERSVHVRGRAHFERMNHA